MDDKTRNELIRQIRESMSDILPLQQPISPNMIFMSSKELGMFKDFGKEISLLDRLKEIEVEKINIKGEDKDGEQ